MVCTVGVMVARGLEAGKGSGFLSRANGRKQEDRPLHLPLVVSSQPAKQQPQTSLVSGVLPCQPLPFPVPLVVWLSETLIAYFGYSAHATQNAVVWGAFRWSMQGRKGASPDPCQA